MTYTKVNHDPRLCLWCSSEFKPRTTHQNFCNKECYRKHGKKFKGHSKGRILPRKKRLLHRKQPYRIHLKESCERCNFIPEHSCQLDIHHIDHNHFNNEVSNLKTLCANCHRLQHIKNPDLGFS